MQAELAQVNTLTPLESALRYASWGWRIFPCDPGSKTPPYGLLWKQAATTDPAQIRAWWTANPNYNIAVAAGGGRHFLDLDQGDGRDGWASYLRLGGPNPPPWPMQHTPGGGLHLMLEGDYRFGNFARRGELGGVDMRTDDGYVLLTPSKVGGKLYRWDTGGDPAAPLPGGLLQALEAWSDRTLSRSAAAVPIPEPTDLSDEEVWQRVDALGVDHAAFLRWGAGATGDSSKDAYRACRAAFGTMGWSLEDMARIGPETTLATFGEGSPHSAANPWAWCWRYTISAAWEDTGQKETAAFEEVCDLEAADNTTSGATADPGEDEEIALGVGSETSSGTVTRGADLGQLLELKGKTLGDGDHPGFAAWLRELECSGLGRGTRLHLRSLVGKGIGLTVDVIKATARDVRESLKRETAQVVESGEEVYVRDQGKLYDPGSGALVSREAFLIDKARGLDGSREDADQVWLTGGDARCRLVESLTYDPALPPGAVEQGGVALYNTYRPGGVVPRGDISPQPWLDLLRALKLEEGEAGERWLIERLAWVVQHPGQKINHGILLGGQPGIGKDSLLAPWLAALGEANTAIVHGEELGSDFNSFVKTQCLLINEIDYGDHRDRRRVAELLKPVLARPPNRLRVNEKNLKAYWIPNQVVVAGMTNHRYCLHVDGAERRWLMLWANLRIDSAGGSAAGSTRAHWDQWFTQYWQWLADGGSGAVLAHLRSVDLRGFNPTARPPVTGWLRDQMDSSADPLEAWLIERIAERAGVFASNVIAIEDLEAVLQSGAAAGFVSGSTGRNRLSRALHAVGARRARCGARRARGWVIREEVTGGNRGFGLEQSHLAGVVELRKRKNQLHRHNGSLSKGSKAKGRG